MTRRAVVSVGSSTGHYLRQAGYAIESFVRFNPGYDTYLVTNADPVDVPYSVRFVMSPDKALVARAPCGWLEPARVGAVLALLRDYGYDEVVYLDGDTETYANLDATVAFPKDKALLFTPHLVEPNLLPSARGEHPNLRQIRRMGQYNSGVFIARKEAIDFLEWWLKATIEDGRIDPAAGMAGAQGWMDYAGAFLGSEKLQIAREWGLNCAYWRFDSSLEFKAPPIVFHFSGLDAPVDPQEISRFESRHVAPLGSQLYEFLNDYKKKVFT